MKLPLCTRLLLVIPGFAPLSAADAAGTDLYSTYFKDTIDAIKSINDANIRYTETYRGEKYQGADIIVHGPYFSLRNYPLEEKDKPIFRGYSVLSNGISISPLEDNCYFYFADLSALVDGKAPATSSSEKGKETSLVPRLSLRKNAKGDSFPFAPLRVLDLVNWEEWMTGNEDAKYVRWCDLWDEKFLQSHVNDNLTVKEKSDGSVTFVVGSKAVAEKLKLKPNEVPSWTVTLGKTDANWRVTAQVRDFAYFNPELPVKKASGAEGIKAIEIYSYGDGGVAPGGKLIAKSIKTYNVDIGQPDSPPKDEPARSVWNQDEVLTPKDRNYNAVINRDQIEARKVLDLKTGLYIDLDNQ